MESNAIGHKEDYITFNGEFSPVSGDTYVQLKLANSNEPIDRAGIFTWSKEGRGIIYPHILGWRHATEEEYNEYQDKKAKRRAETRA